MTVKQAIEKGYTNKGEMFGFIPVYVKNDYDCFEAVGINKFWNFILDIFRDPLSSLNLSLIELWTFFKFSF